MAELVSGSLAASPSGVPQTTLNDWIRWRQWARRQAQDLDISVQEVDQLLEHHGWSILNQRLCREAPDTGLSMVEHYWQARVQDRIPVHYLIGSVYWRDLQLQVNPSVLIPRPETELLVERALSWIQPQSRVDPQLWVDLGTGSGAIAIALAKGRPRVTVYATDISSEALALAQLNAQQMGVAQQVICRAGSWFEAIPELRGQLQGILSNPPYIPSGAIETLQPEVAQYEPRLALDGGTSGLEAIEQLIAQSPQFLQPGGFWAIEIMQGQASEVVQRLQHNGSYQHIEIHPDLAGIDRIVSAQVNCEN